MQDEVLRPNNDTQRQKDAAIVEEKRVEEAFSTLDVEIGVSSRDISIFAL